jgi:hypothetical protein
MTPAECYRLSAAYDFFGLVNGSRCIGFMSLQTAVAVARKERHLEGGKVKRYSCPVRCAGAVNTTCGGSSTMQLYARNKPVPQLAPASGEGQDGWGRGRAGQGSGTFPKANMVLFNAAIDNQAEPSALDAA